MVRRLPFRTIAGASVRTEITDDFSFVVTRLFFNISWVLSVVVKEGRAFFHRVLRAKSCCTVAQT
jgi:hypothetical protein